MDQRMTPNRSRKPERCSFGSAAARNTFTSRTASSGESASLFIPRKARAQTQGLSPGATRDASAESSLSFVQQMRDFLHRNATWLLVAGLVLLCLQDIFGAHGVLAMHRSQREADTVQKEIQQLNKENQKLKDRVQSLRTDPIAIERIAREEMGLARPSEYIFKLQPNPGQPSTPLAQPAAQSASPHQRPKKR
jgi:cell division protein FtsB